MTAPNVDTSLFDIRRVRRAGLRSRLGLTLGTLLVLGGCSALYPTQSLPDSPMAAEYGGFSYSFRIVDLNPATALQANAVWAYRPRPVPGGLRWQPSTTRVTGAQRLVSHATSFGAAPERSVRRPQRRARIELKNPPRSNPEAYRVGVGDTFTVTIRQLGRPNPTEYQYDAVVDYAGNIYLQNIGEVSVAGKSPAQVRQLIATRVSDENPAAVGTATLTQFDSQKVIVAAPGRPIGFVPITTRPLSLRDVYLRSSSGVETDAARQVVVLSRGGKSYPVRGGDVLRRSYGYDVYLRDGDRVQILDEALAGVQSVAIAPDVLAFQEAQRERARSERDEARALRAEQRALAAERRAMQEETRRRAAEARAARQEARSDAAEKRAWAAEVRSERSLDLAEARQRTEVHRNRLAARESLRDLAEARINLAIEDRDRIFVAGEVGKQGMVPLPFGRQFSLAEALYGADGIDQITGDPSAIYVVRVGNIDGQKVENFIFHFDGTNLLNASTMTMFEMRPNDYVVVMPRAITNWSRFVSQLVPTFSALLSASRL